MKHLGDITKINGAEVEPVWVIIGGSPCQDLSVAGKRAGLAGARSGLFMEQIRVIKEMRQRDRDSGRTGKLIRPRYMVWENVPGAFSSNKGEDFRAVLEETARIADGNADVPQPPNGKWSNAGCIMGNGWSIAWRVHDAQFWGVPQRRRRISLVADFGGQSAPEILFERKGVSGDFTESGEARQGTSGDFEGGAGTAVAWYQNGSGECFIGGKAKTIQTNSNASGRGMQMLLQPQAYGFKLGNSEQARSIGFQEERSPTLNAECGGNKPAICYDMTHATDVIRECGETSPTLQSRMGTGENQVPLTFGIGNGQTNQEFTPERTGALNCMHDQKAIATFQNTGRGWWNESDIGATVRTPCGGDSTKANLVAAVDCRNGTENPDINGTLQAKPNGGTSYNLQNTVRTHQSVRRLTPLECERLQGYNDNWTNIPPQTEVTAEDLSFWRTVWDEWQAMNGTKPKTDKQIIKWLQSEPADSARYKALGNSIALPPWRFVLSRIHKQGARTMASLFDGIGSFPKVWSELGGQTLWASEVEPFCVKVTSRRFEGGVNGGMESN